MRRRPMQAWPVRDRAPLGPRGKRVSGVVALFVCALIAVAMPSSAAAGTPLIQSSVDGIAGTNGWLRGSTHGNFVVLHWTVTADPPLTGSTGCDPAIQILGPTKGVTKTCTAKNDEGSSMSSATIKVDADPPTGVSGAPARAPDVNGWYNHSVAFTWTGQDATSGIASCSSAPYSGPDSATAKAMGTCRDKAGNVSSASVPLKYDATAPALSKVGVTSRAGSDLVRWSSTSPSDSAVVQRWARGNSEQPVVYRGASDRFLDKKIQVGLEYVYAIQTTDQAGNASKRITISGLPKVLTLKKMPYIPRAAPNPILRWPRLRGASYYHVQLFRGSKRILAVWPSTRQLALPTSWAWAGHRYKLAPGKYRWYAWAGIGRRSFARYNRIGSARFIVPPG
jgi:hypothetical protein